MTSGSWRRVMPAVGRTSRAIRLVWTSSPGWTAASVALVVVQSVLPLVQLYLLKLIVDAVAGLVRTGEGAAFERIGVAAGPGGRGGAARRALSLTRRPRGRRAGPGGERSPPRGGARQGGGHRPRVLRNRALPRYPAPGAAGRRLSADANRQRPRAGRAELAGAAPDGRACSCRSTGGPPPSCSSPRSPAC